MPKPKDGVIRPPGGVGPEITVKPTDNNATMPVILQAAQGAIRPFLSYLARHPFDHLTAEGLSSQ